MNPISLLLLCLTTSFTALSTTWTITDSGFTFSPSNLTIPHGDDVLFDIAGIHQVVEVSQSTWNANGNTPLPGGFSTPFGGGMISVAQLSVGTHYYVCNPHASVGMKGIIIVEQTTSTDGTQDQTRISIFPYPSTGKFRMTLPDVTPAAQYQLEIFDANGNQVHASSQTVSQNELEIDVSNFAQGIYFLQIRNNGTIERKKIVVQ
jgi:plastocyanin